MRLSFSFLILTLFSTSLYANADLNELEGILLTEIADSPAVSTKKFLQPMIDQEGSTTVTKETSINEILDSLHECSNKEAVQTDKQASTGHMTIAFACRTSDKIITTSEVLISTDGDSPKVVSYQKLEFEENELPPSVMLNIMAKNDFTSISAFDSVSPGIRTLLTLAQVGIPVALSFKTAKVLAPDRTDWQKHFIAGAIISGATILTTQALLRTYARNHGYNFSDTKIAILSSLAGLLTSVVAGAGKEGYDRISGRGTPEFKDALFTSAGGAMVSFGVVIPLDRLFRRRPRPVPVLAY